MRADSPFLDQTAVQHVMCRRRLLAEGMRVGLFDLLAHLFRYFRLCGKAGDRLRCQLDRRQALVLLTLRDHRADGALHLEERLVCLLLVLSECVNHNISERELILGGGALRNAAEHVFDELRVRRTACAHIVHHRVHIAAAVGERRIDKTEVRQADHPVAVARADAVFVLLVAERRLGQIDRADRAQQVLVDLLRLLLLLARGRLGRHIIDVVVDQNKVVAGIAVLLDDLFVQAVEQLLIREPAVAQSQQIGAALVGCLVPVELKLEQIAAERAGNRLFRDFKVLEILVLLQLGEHIGKFEHDLLAAVDVAAAHAVKRALFLFQPAAQLLHIALGNIHKSSLSLLYIEHRLPEKRPFRDSPII